MYCPRCGLPNTESTKFCRQCGLPLAQITDYVATGGTGSLAPPVHSAEQQQSKPQLPQTAEMLALKHKMVLTILSVCIAPILFAVIANEMFKLDDLAGLPILLVPIGIVWAVFHHKTKLLRLQEEQMQQYLAQSQRASTPVQQPMLQLQSHQLYSDQPPGPAIPTNPLAANAPASGSVTEDETQRFPGQRP